MDIDLSDYKGVFIESTKNIDFGWEAEEQKDILLKIDDWNSPKLFQSVDVLFYKLPPNVFKVLALKLIVHDMGLRINNERAVDAIVLALLENKLLLTQFERQEIYFIQRWVGKLIYNDAFLIFYDKEKTILFFSNLFEALK